MKAPLLYQVNLRFWLARLSEQVGRQATLDDIPDDDLQHLGELGFDWLYLICVWKTGNAERTVAQEQTWLKEQAASLLGDTLEASICGSCFAITEYQPPEIWGGTPALVRFQKRLHSCGIRLMLDFIPNHTGISHSWARTHPEYFIHGDSHLLAQHPDAYIKITANQGEQILAHGKDPYFPPWEDTLQLNYANPALQRAMIDEMLQIAEYCDGLRCDMAMLLVPEVFKRSWGLECEPFWPTAISTVKNKHPDFHFMAEVYWGLEYELQHQGFDFTYDKTYYDLLIHSGPDQIKSQLEKEAPNITKQVHFIENHDEQRAASLFPFQKHKAAALLTYLIPGLRFFFAGQLDGFKVRVPIQFCHAPFEFSDPQLSGFYTMLLAIARNQNFDPDNWWVQEAYSAWANNESWRNLVGITWQDAEGHRWLAVINYSEKNSQGYFRLQFNEIRGHRFELIDQINQASYLRDGTEICDRGLYIDLPGWGAHLFQFLQVSSTPK